MIISERHSVRIADIYFDEPRPTCERVDILRHNQVPAAVEGAACVPFPTIVLNLRQTPEQLFTRMKDDSRQKIRRALRDEQSGLLRYEYSTAGSAEWIARFTNHFDRCAAAKTIPSASRSRMALLGRNQLLDISFVSEDTGEILAASCSVRTPKRMRGLYAAAAFRLTTDSHRRSLIGRANRYLYWRDFLRFKDAGADFFDFGGYYLGHSDTDKLRINRFKDSFGGEIRSEFNCNECLTVKGFLANWLIGQRDAYAWRKHDRRVQETSQGPAYDSKVPTQV